MKFSMNGYEEWKEKNRNEKAEISKMDLIEACGRVAAAAAAPEDKVAGIISASMELAKISKKFFPEKKEEEPDAEKPAEKTELSALEKLLFEQTYLAVVQHAAGSSEAYSRFKALYDLIRDAGLEARYYDWKEEKGYE